MAETKAMITELAPLVKDANCDVVLCVPFTDIQTAKRAARGTNIKIGAENVHWAEKERSRVKFPPKCSKNSK